MLPVDCKTMVASVVSGAAIGAAGALLAAGVSYFLIKQEWTNHKMTHRLTTNQGAASVHLSKSEGSVCKLRCDWSVISSKKSKFGAEILRKTFPLHVKVLATH